ncbi:MAG TPA: hypothetical protein PK876_00800 [Elusimicrobiota bacterium]|nr:hypothetical protein [Elusimicrobiota bacterium]
MKIAFLDLNHMTVGVHTNTAPLGSVLIAKHLKDHVRHEFDIRIFKDPFRFLESLKTWQPDCLGLAQYSWNSELNLHAAGLAKKAHPGCFIVAGGPNLPSSAEEKAEFLKLRPFVDLGVNYDGEIPFSDAVQRLVSGEKAEGLHDSPPAGTYSLDSRTRELNEPAGRPPRLESLDGFGPLYAEGWFDGFLDDGFSPFLQTHRGCPFRCAYCHTSDAYYSRMLFQSAPIFAADMDYLGKRFRDRPDVTLYLANTNFGLFEEDIEIARVIRQVQDKYDWPRNFNVNSGKDPKKLLNLISLLKYKFTPSIALQTLTPSVLKNIQRHNLPFDEFTAFQKEVALKIDKNTATELILSLPGETKESFIKTVSTVLNSNVQNIVIYTLMALNGTLISTKEYERRYGFDTRFRIVPRCFSELDGVRIYETEKVVVGTKDMPFEDYMELRALSLVITVFAGSLEMYPIKKYLLENRWDVSRWIFALHDRIRKGGEISSVYRSYLRETQEELFESREALIGFFNTEGRYEQLRAGGYGDNLLRKYKAVLLSRHYAECLDLALAELRVLGRQSRPAGIPETILKDMETFLKSRDVGHLFREAVPRTSVQTVSLNHDIPRWLASEDDRPSLEDRPGTFRYEVSFPRTALEHLPDYARMNQNLELSLQMLYRDGGIKDFWPVWERTGAST